MLPSPENILPRSNQKSVFVLFVLEWNNCVSGESKLLTEPVHMGSNHVVYYRGSSINKAKKLDGTQSWPQFRLKKNKVLRLAVLWHLSSLSARQTTGPAAAKPRGSTPTWSLSSGWSPTWMVSKANSSGNVNCTRTPCVNTAGQPRGKSNAASSSKTHIYSLFASSAS